VLYGAYRMVGPSVFTQHRSALPSYPSDLAPACDRAGTAYTSAMPYQGAGPHPIEVVERQGTSWTDLGGLKTGIPPSSTHATGATTQTDPSTDWDYRQPGEVQLVACATQVRSDAVMQQCSYDTPFNEVLPMKAATYQITLFELRSHRTLGELRVAG